MTNYQQNLAMKAIRRKKLFLVLSIVSVMIALSLAVYYMWEAYTQPNFDVAIHVVLVVMILLNARQNLRQYGYAKILEKLTKESSLNSG